MRITPGFSIKGDCRFRPTNNRNSLYSPERTERKEDLTIAGYEPKPTHAVFPNLRNDDSPYGEIACIERLGRYLVAHTWRRGERAAQELLIFCEAALINSTKQEMPPHAKRAHSCYNGQAKVFGFGGVEIWTMR